MAIWGGWPLFAIFPASYTLKANGNVFFRLWIQAMCVCSMYVCLCTHSVLDNNMYQDSSSSVHNNNRSEGNTGTSRSQPTTGRAHYQGRQLPQIPTLRKIKEDSSGNLVSVAKANPEGSAVLKSFLLTGYEVSDQQQGRAWMMHNLLSGLSKGLMMNFLWVWC